MHIAPYDADRLPSMQGPVGRATASQTARWFAVRRPVVLLLLIGLTGAVLSSPTIAQNATLELSTATIAEINAAFDAGALSAEQLVEHCLARIEAYDAAGPKLNAVLTLNPHAKETARSLDAERHARGPRSPLHGIPVVLKDNFDTADLPTTAGSFMLAGSLPPDEPDGVRAASWGL